jgi:hypothetical protein
MKKLITFILTVSMILAFGLFAFAETTEEAWPDVPEEEIVEDDAVEDLPIVDETVTEDSPEIDEGLFKKWMTEWQEKYEKDQAGKDTPDTFAEWILAQVLKYGPEILAGLAALIALINATYSRTKIKKPFDNFTKKTGDNLNKFTKDISEAVEKYGNESAEALEVVHAYARAMNTLEEEVKTLREKQIALENERKALVSAMKLQSGMLNTVIQSSSIAQWKKDQIGQLHTEATARIDELSNGGDRA